MERGAKVCGARFYYLTGVGARLELALLNLRMQQAIDGRLHPDDHADAGAPGDHGRHRLPRTRTPTRSTGSRPTTSTSRAPPRSRSPATTPTRSSTCRDGPLRYAGWSACYRREAGSYGKDTRGIIRVHQFHKVEMFSSADPEDAEAEHLRLLAFEEQMLAKVEVPYRVIDTAAGDLGGSAARKFDCEAWVPTQGRYRELTSTSNCTTFQARRLDIRYRDRASGQNRDRRHPQRHPGDDPLDRRDPGEPPAGRRLGRACPKALQPYRRCSTS